MFIPVSTDFKEKVIINVLSIHCLLPPQGHGDIFWTLSMKDDELRITEGSVKDVLRAMRLINLNYGNEGTDLLRGFNV